MVRYTAKDLVKAASQIADLENSDFISWNENIRLMNEAYTALYQKLINKNDQSFVVSFTTKDREIELPFDFWQLKNVSIWNNGNVVPILRRSASTSYNSLYYEIRNNVLYITGNFAGEVLVEYWPAPVALYYPPEAKDLGVTLVDIVPFGAYDKKILYKKDVEGKVYWHVYDVENGTDTNLNIEVETKTRFAYIHKNYILFTGHDVDGYYISITDYNGNVIYDSTSHKDHCIPVIYRDAIYDIDPNDNSITFIYGTYYSTDNISIDVSKVGTNNNNVIFYLALDNGAIGKVMPIPGNEETDDPKCLTDLYINNSYEHTIASDYLPLASGNTINTIYRNMMTQHDTDLDKEVSIPTSKKALCISKLDDNTGYGFYTLDGDNNLYIESFLENTCLDFPNSFYFELLSYILADAYKAKQGADDSQILAKLSQMEQVFYDSLSSDAYGPVRITNVY